MSYFCGISNFGQAMANWQFGTVETIRGQSKDGTEIEGVLRKPANFDPNRQYPLVFVVHGGHSNDIPYFTTDYLSGSPFQNREHYPPTAPMSNIANAKTPMLIQHGTEDRRVPLSNAMELYRVLQAMKVPVELFLYPGMGHPITKPRENHAVMTQNLAWFGHYLLGWELDVEGGQ